MSCSEAYSEPCPSSKMELFVKTVNGVQLLKKSFLDLGQGSEHACDTERACDKKLVPKTSRKSPGWNLQRSETFVKLQN